jgi:hypothetical protein
MSVAAPAGELESSEHPVVRIMAPETRRDAMEVVANLATAFCLLE